MSLFTKNLALEFEVSEADVREVWCGIAESVEKESGILRSKFSTNQFKECESRTRRVIEETESIRLADFFESEMGASEFLETLVSGNFNISNIVNRRKTEIESEENYLTGDEVFDDDVEIEEDVAADDEPEYIQEPVVKETVKAGPIMESKGFELPADLKTDLGLSGGGAQFTGPVNSSVPSCLR